MPLSQITNLQNQKQPNPCADLLLEYENKKVVIRIHAENRTHKNHQQNSFDPLEMWDSQEVESAEANYEAEAYWMAIPFASSTYSVYWRALKDLQRQSTLSVQECTIETLRKNTGFQ